MSHRKLIPGKLVVASHNKGKIREINELLGPYGFEVVSAGDLDLPEPVEDGLTFEDNAAIKAEAAAEASGLPSLADDSGFCVEALKGDPGIYSARWAGPDKDFAMAMRTIEEKLQTLEGGAPGNRRGSFVAVLCLAWPDGHKEFFRGEVAGDLVWPPRGSQGFGYDPMFRPDGHTRTFGEMTSEEKHGLEAGAEPLSHRARAFTAFARGCLEGATR